jgi:hypothetical protein
MGVALCYAQIISHSKTPSHKALWDKEMRKRSITMRKSLLGLSLVLVACQAAPLTQPSELSQVQIASLISASPSPSINPSPTITPSSSPAPAVKAIVSATESTVPQATASPTNAPTASPEPAPEILPPQNGCQPLPTSGNLVRNPDFESPQVIKTSDQLTGQSFDSWKVETGSVEIAGPLWQAGSGNQSLDLDGSKQTGSLSQVMQTQAGKSYQLRFCLAGNPDGKPQVKQLEVYWNNRSLARLSFDTKGHDRVKMGWVTQTIVIPGAWTPSELSLLRFVSRNPAGGSWGAMIDALAVVTSL